MHRYLLCALFVASAFAIASPAQAALTPVQVGAVISLLVSFDVDQATIANVWSSLAGTVSKGSISFLATTPATTVRIAAGSKQVSFTSFLIANNTANPVTVAGVTVVRSGTGGDNNLGDVVLLDANNSAVGEPATLDANHQATLGGAFVLKAGEVKALTVAADIAPKGKARTGQTVGLDVVAINVVAALQGSLPISGASYTVDTKLQAN